MIKVKNSKVIHRLSLNTLKANRGRNIIAVFAIALTTILFTVVCTIFGTIVDSYQDSSFREVGYYAHGTFKYLTEEQTEELLADSLIERSGRRLLLGFTNDEMFPKDRAEISYMDETCADFTYISPIAGALPQENTNEIACDTYFLDLLGVEPKLGANINLQYVIQTAAGEKILVEESFILSGWWTKNEMLDTGFVQIPLSYAKKVLSQYADIELAQPIGTWDLNVYLKSSANIEAEMETIAQNHGYQTTSLIEDNYLEIGVNWGYLTTRVSNMDQSTIFSVVFLILLIGSTGYLIIYNVFYISVGNDTRFYGLLKTIGSTGRQLRHLVRRQVLCLCIIGIPLGLVIGYAVGYVLAPIIMKNMTYSYAKQEFHLWVFALAAAFSMITVLISAAKPGRIAGMVSPIEAVRYTESRSSTRKKRKQKSKKGKKASPISMAWANLSRSKRKTALVLISLSLAVLLLQVTVTFTNGFDMEKYLSKHLAADFVVSEAEYFKPGGDVGEGINEEDIDNIKALDGMEDCGRVYMEDDFSLYYAEDDFREELEKNGYSQEDIVKMVAWFKDDETGLILYYVMLYGMEAFPIEQLDVIEGELYSLQDISKNSIAAVYATDDYGNVDYGSCSYKLGDEVTFIYYTEWEYYDEATGEVYEEPTDFQLETLSIRSKEKHDVTYTVTALVTINKSMSFRSSSDAYEFILSADTLRQETGVDTARLFMFNTTEAAEGIMETLIQDYTQEVNSSLDYESKEYYIESFSSFQNMFLILGGTLSFIVGLVGILNFFNSIFTSILARRREFAVLQSIGMTGRQLKQMLVWEGVFYTIITIFVVLILTVFMSPLLGDLFSEVFWFYSYRFTLVPIAVVTPVFLVLGILLPLTVYHFAAKKTLVDRLRDIE